MKQVALKKLGDKAIFQFGKYSKVIWEVQSKSKGLVIVTATKSGITKSVTGNYLVWCKDE